MEFCVTSVTADQNTAPHHAQTFIPSSVKSAKVCTLSFIRVISIKLPASVKCICMSVCPPERYIKKKELDESLISHPSVFMQNLMKHGMVSVLLITVDVSWTSVPVV